MPKRSDPNLDIDRFKHISLDTSLLLGVMESDLDNNTVCAPIIIDVRAFDTVALGQWHSDDSCRLVFKLWIAADLTTLNLSMIEVN